ncbi:hypothetical protein Raf01_51100 [Rugosimonospora africana]|uniref:Uncharacterized protein n=1 Tax=Rugosimonospora africana TaxID=556532 RepID=A0A8J3QUA3_9ACTN|nr:hypothetical protein Raf01_51100 [Rugosimonospora africana]
MRTFAVAFIVMVTGACPQEKVMIPPAATAATTAAEVQLAGVPLPTTRVGWVVSTAFASAGTAAWPFGLPAFNSATVLGLVTDGLGEADRLGVGLAAGLAVADGMAAAARQSAVPEAEPQPVRAVPSRSPAASTAVTRGRRTGRL